MKTETMEELLGSYPFFTGLSADAVRLMAGCASNMHSFGVRLHLRRGRSCKPLLPDPA